MADHPQGTKLFTPGPVPMDDEILAFGTRQLPYHRSKEFAGLVFDITDGLRWLTGSSGEVALMTCSGTGAMEASVLGFLTERDKTLVVNGGTFGARWAELCRLHGVPCEELVVEPGKSRIEAAVEARLDRGDITCLLANACEMSTGASYDIRALGKLCRARGVLLVVDAIASICADPYSMDAWGVDVTVLSSHKGLALPPGMAFVVYSERASARLDRAPRRSYYLDLARHATCLNRGTTPYTPAIGIMVMLARRLEQLQRASLDTLHTRHQVVASHFRRIVREGGLEIVAERPSNAITALKSPVGLDALAISSRIEERFGYFLAPNLPPLDKTIFRVSHLGAQTPKDADRIGEAIVKTIMELSK